MSQLTLKTRFAILKRDNHTCQYCGKKPPEVVLHVEHKKAISNGGKNDPENLVTSCRECNLGKYAEDYKEKYPNNQNFIKRTYRISPENDKKIKLFSKNGISESEIIRKAIKVISKKDLTK